MSIRFPIIIASVFMANVLSACSGEATDEDRDALIEQGKAAAQAAGCGSCHSIPGVEGANGRVGPPLDHFARRAYIAGIVPNNVDNLVPWLERPREIAPHSAMPDTGLTRNSAEAIAAFLYTLE